MNPVQFFEYGKNNSFAAQPNTFIGGLAAAYPTKAALATKLGILENDISLFEIRGNNIAAKIEVNYTIGFELFQADLNILWYVDKGAKVTRLVDFCFRGASNFVYGYFPNDLIYNNQALFNNSLYSVIELPNLTNIQGSIGGGRSFINIPSVLTIGSTSNSETFFGGANQRLKIIANSAMQTANAGAMEGDLLAAQTSGAEIIFKTNATTPNKITDLSVRKTYKYYAELEFTLPATTNPIILYLVELNGEFNGIYRPDEDVMITGLQPSTSYSNITVTVIDRFFNKSVSNAVNVLTVSTAKQPTSRLQAYYNLNDVSTTIVADSYGSNNGVNNGATVGAIGKLGNAFSFAGNVDCTFTAIQNMFDSDFTIGFYYKGTQSTNFRAIENRGGGALGTVKGWAFGVDTGALTFDGGNGIWYQIPRNLWFINDDSLHEVIMTWNSYLGIMEAFLDNVKIASFESVSLIGLSFNTGKPVVFGKSNSNNQYYNGLLDEAFFAKKRLRSDERKERWNNGTGVTI